MYPSKEFRWVGVLVPGDAVINYQKLGGLRQGKFILSHFCRQEVQNQDCTSLGTPGENLLSLPTSDGCQHSSLWTHHSRPLSSSRSYCRLLFTSSLPCLFYKDTCDCTLGPICIIQDKHLSKFLTQSHFLTYKVMFRGSRD